MSESALGFCVGPEDYDVAVRDICFMSKVEPDVVREKQPNVKRSSPE